MHKMHSDTNRIIFEFIYKGKLARIKKSLYRGASVGRRPAVLGFPNKNVYRGGRSCSDVKKLDEYETY